MNGFHFWHESCLESPLLPKRLLFMHGSGGETSQRMQETMDKIRQAEAKQSNEAKIRAQFEALRKMTENLASDEEGFTEKDQKAVGKKLRQTETELAREQVTERLDGASMHLEVSEFKTLKGNDLVGWIENIAQKNGTTVDQIIKDNPGVIKKIEQKHVGGKIKQHHVGKHYVLDSTKELKIRIPNRAASQKQLENRVHRTLDESGAKRQEQIIEERNREHLKEAQAKQEEIDGANQKLTERVVAERQNLIGKEVVLPIFLQGLSRNPEAWRTQISRAGQAENAGVKRLETIVDDAPLGWSLETLLNAVNRGRDKVFSFNDLTKHSGFKESEGEFMKRYEALTIEIAKEKNETVKKGLEVEKAQREAFMRQAFELLEAMNDMTEGQASEGISTFDQMIEHEGLQEAKGFKMNVVYDLDSVLGGNATSAQFPAILKQGENWEIKAWNSGNIEGIGANPKTVEEARSFFKTLNVPEKAIAQMHEGFVLEFATACFGLETLIQGGYIKKAQGVLYLDSLPTAHGFSDQNVLLHRVAETFDVQGFGKNRKLHFDSYAAQEMKLNVLKQHDPQEYLRELGRQSFQGREDSQNMEQVRFNQNQNPRKQKRVEYKDRDLDEEKQTPESRWAELISDPALQQFNPETGQYEFNEQLLQDRLEYFLDLGIERYADDPDIDIITELQTANIDLREEDIKEYRTHEKKVRQMAKEIERVESRLQGKKAKSAAIDVNDLNNIEKIQRVEEEIDALEKELNRLQIERDTVNREKRQIISGVMSPEHLDKTYLQVLKDRLSIPKHNQEKLARLLTPSQQHFIQMGYVASGGKMLRESGPAKALESRMETLKKYEHHSILSPVFEQLQQRGVLEKLSGEDMEKIAQSVNQALEEPMVLQDLSLITPDSRESQAGIGVLINDLKNQKGALGAYKIIKVPGSDIEINLGVGVTTEREMAAGVGKSEIVQLDYRTIGVVSVNVGASVGPEGVNAGFTVGQTAIRRCGKLDLHIGATEGFGIKNGMPTVGLAFHVGVEKSRDTYRDEARRRKAHESGTDVVDREDLSVETKMEQLAQIPEFQEMMAELKRMDIPEATRGRMLLDHARRVNERYENAGEAGLKILIPINGFKLTFLPFAGVMLPTVSFIWGGETHVYLSVPETLNAEIQKSGEAVQAQIKKSYAEYAKGKINLVEDRDVKALPQNEFSYTLDGGRSIIPQSHEETHLVLNEMVGSNLKNINEQLHRIGLSLSPGKGATAGLLNFDVHGIGVEERGFQDGERPRVDIRLDPSMRARLVAGEKQDGRHLYLALDQLSGQNLIATRETFILPRKEGGTETLVRITLKSNPSSTANFNQFEDRNSGMMRIETDGSVQIHGTEQGNVMTWEQYQTQKESLIQTGLSTEKIDRYFRENAKVTESGKSATLDSREADIDTAKLQPFAESFIKNRTYAKLVREAKLFDANLGTQKQLMEALQKEWHKINPERPLREVEVNYLRNVLNKLSYADKRGRNAAERKAYFEKHRAFFQKVLEKSLGETLGVKILSDIERSNDELKNLPPDTEVFTVVGTKGVRGLAADLIQDATITNGIDYSNDLAMREAILNQLEPLSENPQDFLRNSLALRAYEQYGLLASPQAKNLLDKLFTNPNQINTLLLDPTTNTAFEQFKKIARQLRAAELSQQPIVLTNDVGMVLTIQVPTKIYAGQLSHCDNPTFAIDHNILIKGFEGYSQGVIHVESQAGHGHVQKTIRQLSLTGRIEKPAPPIEEPLKEEGEPSGEGTGSEDEGAEEGDQTDGGEGEQGGDAPSTFPGETNEETSDGDTGSKKGPFNGAIFQVPWGDQDGGNKIQK